MIILLIIILIISIIIIITNNNNNISYLKERDDKPQGPFMSYIYIYFCNININTCSVKFSTNIIEISNTTHVKLQYK